jgi:histone H3/H4
MDEIEQTTDFKNHTLPLARIKKTMKADEDVRMISAEAPVVFAKACEVFILELTLRSWMHTEENKRRTLQKNHIAAAITRTDIYDFLVDIIPRDVMKEERLGLPRVGLPPAMRAQLIIVLIHITMCQHSRCQEQVGMKTVRIFSDRIRDRIRLEGFRSVYIRVRIFNIRYCIRIQILKSYIYDVDIQSYLIRHG